MRRRCIWTSDRFMSQAGTRQTLFVFKKDISHMLTNRVAPSLAIMFRTHQLNDHSRQRLPRKGGRVMVAAWWQRANAISIAEFVSYETKHATTGRPLGWVSVSNMGVGGIHLASTHLRGTLQNVSIICLKHNPACIVTLRASPAQSATYSPTLPLDNLPAETHFRLYTPPLPT